MILSYIIILVTLLQSNSCEILRGKQGFAHGQQDWGYIEVRPMAHMFWWLYYAAPPVIPIGFEVMERPLIIWLQGGPGVSASGVGNFEEFGPVDSNLDPRNYTWVDDYNVLFIDSPVGTGFSYIEHFEFAMNNGQIADDLLECIKGIFNKLPHLRKIPTYIVGEAYGAKMAVEFAWVWHKAQQKKKINSTLVGMALGDPIIDPLEAVLAWPLYLLEIGLIDSGEYNEINKGAEEVKALIDDEQYFRALEQQLNLEDLINKRTNNVNVHNILYKNPPFYHDDQDEISKLERLMNQAVKKALRLNPNWQWKEVSNNAQNALNGDRMKTVAPIFELVLERTDLKIAIYSGQLDMLMSTPGTLNMVERLRWRGAKQWEAAPKLPLVVMDIVEGYKKSHDKLTMYWINRAGRRAAKDNPSAVSAVLSDLTSSHSIHQYEYNTETIEKN